MGVSVRLNWVFSHGWIIATAKKSWVTLTYNPMLQYLISIKKTEAYPTEEDFSKQFDKLENDVNKHAGCLIGFYGGFRYL